MAFVGPDASRPVAESPIRFDPQTGEPVRFDPDTGAPIRFDQLTGERLLRVRASFGRRAAAVGIDYLIGIPILVIPPALGLMGGSDSAALAAVLVLYFMVYPLYYSLAEGLLGGRTLGKALVGIAVTRPGGEPAGLGRTCGRELARIGMVFGWVLPWVDHLFAVGRQRRTLHDRIAGTVVVNRPRSHRTSRIAWGIVGVILGVAALSIVYDELWGVASRSAGPPSPYLYENHFSDACTWPTVNNPAVSLGCHDGGYLVSIKRADPDPFHVTSYRSTLPYSKVSVTVGLVKTASRRAYAGVELVSTDRSLAYAFVVGRAGNARIVAERARANHVQQTTLATAHVTAGRTIRIAGDLGEDYQATNRLRLRLFVGGRVVATAYRPVPEGDGLPVASIVVWSPDGPASARFDDFAVEPSFGYHMRG